MRRTGSSQTPLSPPALTCEAPPKLCLRPILDDAAQPQARATFVFMPSREAITARRWAEEECVLRDEPARTLDSWPTSMAATLSSGLCSLLVAPWRLRSVQRSPPEALGRQLKPEGPRCFFDRQASHTFGAEGASHPHEAQGQRCSQRAACALQAIAGYPCLPEARGGLLVFQQENGKRQEEQMHVRDDEAVFSFARS